MERRHVMADALLTVHSREMDAVFRKYARYVAAIAYRVLHDRHDAEDVVQEVFLDAVRGLDRLRDEAALRAWLGVVTIRNAMQRRRQRSSSLLCAYDDEAVNELATSHADDDQHLKLSAVAAVIESLPHELRLPWM